MVDIGLQGKCRLTKPGSIPLDKEWKLVFCLRQHFEHEKGMVKGAEWSKQRTEKARFWLRAWQKLEQEIKRDFNFEDRPPAEVPPPPGLRIREGTPLLPPQAIPDPKLRKQYAQAIEENKKKRAEYARQVELHDLDKRYVKKAEHYLVAMYAIPPFNRAELEQYLNEYRIGQDVSSRILKEVDHRTTTHLAAQKTKKPAPWLGLRQDPRLAVLVTLGGDNPKFEEVLQRLREATGLDLTIADNLADHEPDIGQLKLGDRPRAWQVMELVAHRQLQGGRWEKTENGYRLTGDSLALRQPTTNLFVVLLVWLLPGIAILGAAGFYLRRRKRASLPAATQAASGSP